MDGAMLPSRNRPIHSFYKDKSIDTQTGKITQNNLTRYGDIKSPSLIGISY
jgi:hypothetical protein